MISVEGLLSEHDIPLEGEPTGKGELYGSASVAWTRRYGRKQPEALVQIGFGLDMKIGEFHRKPLNLAVVVDVSGSMRHGRKMESTKQALLKLVDQLGAKDRMALISFNNRAEVLLESTAVTDKEKIRGVIKGLRANGGTCIEAGMDAGYRQVAAHLGEAEKSARVFLLTDARPNIGVTRPDGFQPMMEGAAALGIGVTAFGVGIDFGQHLAYSIFQVRGANYFYLENAEKISKVFDDEFDFMVTPVAYDIKVELTPAKGAAVADVLGVPDFEKESGTASMSIPSLFLSKRQGGGTTMVAVSMKAPQASEGKKIGDIELGFVTVAGEKITQKLVARLPGELDPSAKIPYFSQPGAKKATVLADAAVALRAACSGAPRPSPGHLMWNLAPEEVAAKPAAVRRTGPVANVEKGSAKGAAEGLGKFADWFASQISDVPGAEKELRLIEQLENTLRASAGLAPVKARDIAGVARPAFPPDVF
jgi:Ca-activated chloride channel family protein